jgi:mRNA interferase RelE/StbE
VTYQVFLAREAAKVLDRLDRPSEQRIRSRISQLAEDPFDPRLSSPLIERDGIRKSRVGGWRILFAVDHGNKIIQVLIVDTRGQVYKHN